MIDTKIIKSIKGAQTLVETFTTESETKKLLQVETGKTYLKHAIDIITGYKEDGTPIAKYTYKEVDKTQEEIEQEAKMAEFSAELRKKREEFIKTIEAQTNANKENLGGNN